MRKKSAIGSGTTFARGSPPQSIATRHGRPKPSSKTLAGSKADWPRTRSGSTRRSRSTRYRAICSRELWSGHPLAQLKESVMSTAKTVVVVLVLLIAFGIVGRMDYEDAKRVARANGEEGIRLFCVRFSTDGSA